MTWLNGLPTWIAPTILCLALIFLGIALFAWLKHRHKPVITKANYAAILKQRLSNTDSSDEHAFMLSVEENPAHAINFQHIADYQLLKQEGERLAKSIQETQWVINQNTVASHTQHALSILLNQHAELTHTLSAFKRDILALTQASNKIPLNTRRLRQAKQAFNAGDYKAARNVFNAPRMARELQRLRLQQPTDATKQATLQRDLDNLAEEFLLLARLTALDFQLGSQRLAKTSHYFELALKVGHTPERVLAYAEFLHKFPPLATAETLYTEALQQYRVLAQKNASAYQPEVALVLDRLGVLVSAIPQRQVQAEIYFTEAISLYRELAESNSPAFQNQVATTLNHLCQLLKNQPTRRSEAISLFKELLTTYRHLAKLNPWTHQINVATTLNNLAVLLSHDPQQRDTAETHYREALLLYRQQAKLQPTLYQHDVAMTLNNLANVISHDLNREAETKQLYNAALSLYRESAKANPSTFQPLVSNTLGALGFAQLRWHQPQSAINSLSDACRILQPFAEQLPRIHLKKYNFMLTLQEKAKRDLPKTAQQSESFSISDAQ